MTHPKIKRFGKRIEGFFVRIKQRAIVHHLLRKSGGAEVVAAYAGAQADDGEPIAADAPVWVCWWQGEAAMPDIAKACVRSIRRHAGTHPVVFITKDNYAEYADMPADIVEMQIGGVIDLTHFADILRMQLLRRHGGIWMDATVLIPAKELASFIRTGTRYWSCRHRPIYHNISRGGWTSFFLACGRNCPLPAVIADLHLAYWRRHRRLIDYLLLDYCFAIARRHVPAVAELVDRVPLSVMGPLGKCLNAPFDPQEWQRFCEEYDFHKLTYKIPLHRMTPDGRKTYYGHIMETFFDAPVNTESV